MNLPAWFYKKNSQVKMILFILACINIVSFVVIGRSLWSLKMTSSYNKTNIVIVTLTPSAKLTPTISITPSKEQHTVVQTQVPSFTPTAAKTIVPITKQIEVTQTASPTTSPTLSPTVVSGTIKISQTVSQDGVTFLESIQMPVAGGALTGTITGDCDGSIVGTYAGPTTYAMQGKNSEAITCTSGFFSLSINETFNGIISPNPKTYKLTYSVTGTGISQSGTETGMYTIQ